MTNLGVAPHRRMHQLLFFYFCSVYGYSSQPAVTEQILRSQVHPQTDLDLCQTVLPCGKALPTSRTSAQRTGSAFIGPVASVGNG